MVGQYNKAIIWADKALQVDPKDCDSLYTKGDSLHLKFASLNLRLLKNYTESMKVIEYSLKINPNHFGSLISKGKCLKPKNMMYYLIQDQHQHQEALTFYQKALKIIPNDQWVKDRQDECLKVLNKT